MLAATAAAVTAERAWMRAGGHGVSPISLLDPDMECEHERLRGDPSPPCGCWAGETVPAPVRVPEPPKEIVVTPVAKKKTPRPVVSRESAGDMVDRILADLDGEIARLTAAREALAQAVGR